MLDAWAWALLHFVWQGALIAAGTEVGLRMLHHAPAQVRYQLAGSSLGLMACCVPLTAAALWADPAPSMAGILGAGLGVPAVGWARGLVALWSLGVVLLGTRTLLGLLALRRMRHAGISAPPALRRRFRALSARFGLTGVELKLIRGAAVPMAVGWLRPAVLLPAALIVKLPPDQLESLLLHELAHVRRWDWLLNLVQSAAETLLFYHPAVWWLSGRIRHERELCCDEEVLLHAASLPYARALAQLEALRQLPAPAASGGDLMDRILRIVGEPRAARKAPWLVPALLLAAAIGFSGATNAVAAVAMTWETSLGQPVMEVRAPDREATVSRPAGSSVPVRVPPIDRRPDHELTIEELGARTLRRIAQGLEGGPPPAVRQSSAVPQIPDPPPATLRPRAPPASPAPPAPHAGPALDHDPGLDHTQHPDHAHDRAADDARTVERRVVVIRDGALGREIRIEIEGVGPGESPGCLDVGAAVLCADEHGVRLEVTQVIDGEDEAVRARAERDRNRSRRHALRPDGPWDTALQTWVEEIEHAAERYTEALESGELDNGWAAHERAWESFGEAFEAMGEALEEAFDEGDAAMRPLVPGLRWEAVPGGWPESAEPPSPPSRPSPDDVR